MWPALAVLVLAGRGTARALTGSSWPKAEGGGGLSRQPDPSRRGAGSGGEGLPPLGTVGAGPQGGAGEAGAGGERSGVGRTSGERRRDALSGRGPGTAEPGRVNRLPLCLFNLGGFNKHPRRGVSGRERAGGGGMAWGCGEAGGASCRALLPPGWEVGGLGGPL